jgi:hypothetical protein
MADDNQTTYQQRLAEYRRRLSELAYDAQSKLGLAPIDVAGSHWGCGRGVIAVAYGDEAADERFEQLVKVVRGDEGEPDPKPTLKLVQ